jgi:periplasmic divalent cation tolerance protein
MSVLLVLCTHPDPVAAEELAATLVEQRLAACVNILPGLRSVYRWQGRVEKAQEVLLLIKTAPERFEALKEAIVKLLPYSLPEVIAFESGAGLDRYLEWVRTETAISGDDA